ncbi:mitochondrial membrane protein [Tulasnella sp. JGI-2019a]|nr:mitochondrial membrane protein [Tulasnella sp. JGI-2019a]KAG9037557.1 mitochondrial membrane protein [Tulasnella sp. JGI-2019a]
MLMAKEPTNLQAQSLEGLIDQATTRDGYIGMALVGGAAAIGTLLIAGLGFKVNAGI